MNNMNTSFVIFGIELDAQEAKNIHDILKDENSATQGVNLGKMKDGFQVSLYSKNSCLESQSIDYEPGLVHVFGVSYAYNGYEGADDLFEAVGNPPRLVQEIFNSLAKPFLSKLNIDKTAHSFFVHQNH